MRCRKVKLAYRHLKGPSTSLPKGRRWSDSRSSSNKQSWMLCGLWCVWWHLHFGSLQSSLKKLYSHLWGGPCSSALLGIAWSRSTLGEEMRDELGLQGNLFPPLLAWLHRAQTSSSWSPELCNDLLSSDTSLRRSSHVMLAGLNLWEKTPDGGKDPVRSKPLVRSSTRVTSSCLESLISLSSNPRRLSFKTLAILWLKTAFADFSLCHDQKHTKSILWFVRCVSWQLRGWYFLTSTLHFP